MMKLLLLLACFLILILAADISTAQLHPATEQHLAIKNHVLNSGFENGVGKNYTASASGILTLNTAAANLATGKASAAFDPTSTSQYFQTSQIAIPEYLKNSACLVRAHMKGGDANLKLQILDGSDNLLQEKILSTQTYFAPIDIAFTCATSGMVRIRVISTGNAVVSYWDDFFFGSSSFSGAGSGTKYNWQGYHFNDCGFQVSSTAFSYISLNGDSSCTFTQVISDNFPAVTSATSGSNKLPGITFTPTTEMAGTYYVCAHTVVGLYAANNVNFGAQLADQTGFIINKSQQPFSSNGGDLFLPVELCGLYALSGTSPITFEIKVMAISSGKTLQIGDASTSAGDRQIDWTVFRIN